MSSGDGFLLLLSRSHRCLSQIGCRWTSHCPSTLRPLGHPKFLCNLWQNLRSSSVTSFLAVGWWTFLPEESGGGICSGFLPSGFSMAANILSWKSYPGVFSGRLLFKWKVTYKNLCIKPKSCGILGQFSFLTLKHSTFELFLRSTEKRQRWIKHKQPLQIFKNKLKFCSQGCNGSYKCRAS